MSGSGSRNGNKTVFTGSYTAPNGRIFIGTWTVPVQDSSSSDPLDPPPPAPPLLGYDFHTH